MKKFTRNLALALSLLLGASAVPAAEESLDSAAAIVNNDIILESELDKASSTLARNFQRRGQAVDEVSARKAALEALITRSLVLQLAQNQGITLTDMQLDTALAQTAAQRGISVQDLLASIAPGQSEAQAREQFRDELILTEVRRARIRARINVSDTEVDLLAQNLRKVGSVEPQYHLAQIIVPAENGNAVAANRTVAQIRAQLRDGADFNALAARYAIGSAASQAGD